MMAIASPAAWSISNAMHGSSISGSQVTAKQKRPRGMKKSRFTLYFDFCVFIAEVCVLLLSLGLVGFVGCDSFRRQANCGPDASVHFLPGVKEHDSCWIERKLDLMAKPEELVGVCLLFIACTLHSTLYSILYQMPTGPHKSLIHSSAIPATKLGKEKRLKAVLSKQALQDVLASGSPG